MMQILPEEPLLPSAYRTCSLSSRKREQEIWFPRPHYSSMEMRQDKELLEEGLLPVWYQLQSILPEEISPLAPAAVPFLILSLRRDCVKDPHLLQQWCSFAIAYITAEDTVPVPRSAVGRFCTSVLLSR